jgi:hypothetical protein
MHSSPRDICSHRPGKETQLHDLAESVLDDDRLLVADNALDDLRSDEPGADAGMRPLRFSFASDLDGTLGVLRLSALRQLRPKIRSARERIQALQDRASKGCPTRQLVSARVGS